MGDSTNSTDGSLNYDVVMYDSVGVSWILVCTFLVISMQLGFAMLEVGSVREAHRDTVLAKNVMDSVVSCIFFWLHVEMFAPSIIMDNDGAIQYHILLFHWAFCATSVTICSGAMAERTHMGAYLAYSVVMAGVIYPVVAEAAWGTEDSWPWLSEFFRSRQDGEHAYHDFAGSGIVHLVGGISALVGNCFLGRRIMKPSERREEGSVSAPVSPPIARVPSASSGAQSLAEQQASQRPQNQWMEEVFKEFDEEEKRAQMLVCPPEGWPRRFENPERDAKEFKALNYLQVMGTFTLWVGWYGFNTGSTLGLDGPAALAAGIVAWNTSLSAAAGGIGAYLNCCLFQKKPVDVAFMCNGVLGGLVAITASCDVAQDYSALIAGGVAGMVVFPVAKFLMEVAHLDDAVDAIPVHAGCGAWGVLFVAFCRPKCKYLEANGGGMEEQQRFCAEDYAIGAQLMAQASGILAIFLWAALTSFALWFIFVISERTRAQEVQYLEEADRLLENITYGAGADAPQALETGSALGNDASKEWENVLRYSTLARRVCKKQGWTPRGFTQDQGDTYKLKEELREIMYLKAETSLEEACGAVRVISSCLHKTWPLRELAKLRLRVSPKAELSGLGAADAEGVRFREVLRKVWTEKSSSGDTPQQVQNLFAVVRDHERLLSEMLQRRRHRQQQQLGRIPEANSPEKGSATSVGDERRAGDPANADAPEAHPEPSIHQPPADVVGAPFGRGPRSVSSVGASSDGRTVADRSAGNMSHAPSGTSVETPDPSYRRSANPPGNGNEQFSGEVMQRLLEVLQANQAFMGLLAQQQGGQVPPDQAQYERRPFVATGPSEYGSSMSSSTTHTHQNQLMGMPVIRP